MTMSSAVRQAWPVLILGSAVASYLLVALDVDSPLRSLVLLWFLGFCPGMAVARAAGLGSGAAGWMIAMALSVALAGLIATAALVAGVWSVSTILLPLVLVAIVGAILDAVRGARETRTP